MEALPYVAYKGMSRWTGYGIGLVYWRGCLLVKVGDGRSTIVIPTFLKFYIKQGQILKPLQHTLTQNVPWMPPPHPHPHPTPQWRAEETAELVTQVRTVK